MSHRGDTSGGCTCNDCPLHGVSTSDLVGTSFESGTLSDSSCTLNSSLDDADSDGENMPPLADTSSPLRAPLNVLRPAPHPTRYAHLAARSAPLATPSSSPPEPSSPTTSSYQSLSSPRSNNEGRVVYERPDFAEVSPPSLSTRATSMPASPVKRCAAPTSSAQPSSKRRAPTFPPVITNKPVVSRAPKKHLPARKPSAVTASNATSRLSIAASSGRDNRQAKAFGALRPQPPATSEDFPAVDPLPTASEGLRAINLLAKNELTEDDDMPPNLRKKSGTFYIIYKGTDSSFSNTEYFSGVFNDLSFCLRATHNVPRNGLESLTKNVDYAWKEWTTLNIEGSLVNPVHSKSLFPRIVTSAQLSARLGQLVDDDDDDVDDDMYAYENNDAVRVPTSTPANPVASSSSQPFNAALMTKGEKDDLWEYYVTSCTDWDMFTVKNVVVWLVTRGIMPARYYHKRDFIEALGSHWRAEGYLFKDEETCRAWVLGNLDQCEALEAK